MAARRKARPDISDIAVAGPSKQSPEELLLTLDAFRAAPLQPLEPGTLGRLVGFYGVYAVLPSPTVAEMHEAHDYLKSLARAGMPVYVGKAQSDSLKSRLTAHLRSITQAADLDPGWFSLKAIHYDCDSQILDEIQLAKDAFAGQLPWNNSGFGNKTTGEKRKDQQRTDYDVVHVGRGRAASDEKKKSREEILARWESMTLRVPAALAAYEAELVRKVAASMPRPRPRRTSRRRVSGGTACHRA